MEFIEKEDRKYYCKDGNCSIIIDASMITTDEKEIQTRIDNIAMIYLRAFQNETA